MPENNIENMSQGSSVEEYQTPAYIDAVVKKKPRADDPKDIAIKGKIRDHLEQGAWALEVIEKIRQEQITYLKKMLECIERGESSLIYAHTQDFLKEIAQQLRSQIVMGAEYLDQIPKGENVLLMTNHLGFYKLAGINPQESLGVDISGYDFMYPSPLYFGGLSPVAEALGDGLSYVSDDFPGVFGTIHREAGFVHVPPPTHVSSGRTEALLQQTQKLFTNHPHSAVVNYPEGGTSGKYSGLGPYDLDPFRTGGYVIASHLKTPVMLVGQYFDPDEGLQLAVFPPYVPQETDKEGYERYAKEDKDRMQAWLNEKLGQ